MNGDDDDVLLDAPDPGGPAEVVTPAKPATLGAKPAPPAKKKGGMGCLGWVLIAAVILIIGGGAVAAIGAVAAVAVGGGAFFLMSTRVEGPGMDPVDLEPIVEAPTDLPAVIEAPVEPEPAADTDAAVAEAPEPATPPATSTPAASTPASAPPATTKPRETTNRTTGTPPPRTGTTGSPTTSTGTTGTTEARAPTNRTAPSPTGTATSGTDYVPATKPASTGEGARVSMEGDGKIVLIKAGKRYPVPGTVPAGKYDMEATFPGEPAVAVGSLKVPASGELVLTCNARMGICRPK